MPDRNTPIYVKSTLGFFSNLVWALRIVWDSGRVLTGISAVLVIIDGFLPLAALYLTKLVIDSVSAGLNGTDKTAIFGHSATLVALLGSVFLLEAIMAEILSLVNTAQAQIVTDRMHDILHSKSIEMDLEYYENPEYYDTLHRAQQEAPYRPTAIPQSVLALA